MVKQPVHIFAAMLALALVSFSCDADEPTDGNQYLVDITLEKPLGSHSHHVLVGSEFGVELASVVEGDIDGNGGGLGCATRSGSGVVVELDDGEFVVEAVGDGAVELADPGISCPANTDVLAELGPDRWSVIGTDPAEVVGRWAYSSDAGIADYSTSPGPLGVFPDILGRPIDELRVVADSHFTAAPALVRPFGDEEVEVRWSDENHELMVPAHYDELRPRSDDGTVHQSLGGVLGAGESFSASVTILGTSFALPQVHAVPVDAIQSLELVPIYDAGDTQREWGTPLGVVAITRDSEGRRVVGAPVQFELTQGRLSLDDDGDTLYVGDVCRSDAEAPTARTATIAASLGRLETSIELEWIALPGQNGSLLDDTTCTTGCACTSASTPGDSTPGLLALFGLGLWLRLRRRSP